MRTVTNVRDLERARGEWRRPVGLVPTMGYFHDGHCSLMRRARAENATVVTSLFVNPTQFGPREDFGSYPRDFERDSAMAFETGTDVLFVPSASHMYPEGYDTYVAVGGPAASWEGERRPGLFRGVATVVLKLFNLAQPDAAYFGEKDYQQLQAVRRMVTDLNVPVNVVACPTVREPDGLAMSSRNVYLSAAERKQAPTIYKALQRGQQLVQHGVLAVPELKDEISTVLAGAPDLRVDYLAIVDARSLEELAAVDREARILVAAYLGRTRLIDNAALHAPPVTLL